LLYRRRDGDIYRCIDRCVDVDVDVEMEIYVLYVIDRKVHSFIHSLAVLSPASPVGNFGCGIIYRAWRPLQPVLELYLYIYIYILITYQHTIRVAIYMCVYILGRQVVAR